MGSETGMDAGTELGSAGTFCLARDVEAEDASSAPDSIELMSLGLLNIFTR